MYLIAVKIMYQDNEVDCHPPIRFDSRHDRWKFRKSPMILHASSISGYAKVSPTATGNWLEKIHVIEKRKIILIENRRYSPGLSITTSRQFRRKGGNFGYARNRGERAGWRILRMKRRRWRRIYKCARWLKWLCGWEDPSRARWWLYLSWGSIISSKLVISIIEK